MWMKSGTWIRWYGDNARFYDKDYIAGEKQVVQIVGDAGFHESAVLLHIRGTNP